MKKISFVLLALILTVAGVYLASSRNQFKLFTSSVTTRSTGEAKPHTPEDARIKFLEARAAGQSDDSEAYRMLAAALVGRAETTGDAADYDRASEELDRAEALDPGVARHVAERAALLLSRHRFGQARAVAEQGLQNWSENPELMSIAGDGARETGDLDGAEAHYRKLVEVQPRKASSWSRLSHLAESRGDLAQAAALMEKAIDAPYPRPLSTPAFAWARTILGEIEAKRGNLDEARRQYMWALHKYPGYPLAVEFLADLDQWEGKLDAAEAGYRKLLERNADPKIQLSLANLLVRRGEGEEPARLRAEARRFYEWAVENGNEGYLRPLATLDLAEARYDRAAELAARDMALRPTIESRALCAGIHKAAEQAGKPITSQTIAAVR